MFISSFPSLSTLKSLTARDAPSVILTATAFNQKRHFQGFEFKPGIVLHRHGTQSGKVQCAIKCPLERFSFESRLFIIEKSCSI